MTFLKKLAVASLLLSSFSVSASAFAYEETAIAASYNGAWAYTKTYDHLHRAEWHARRLCRQAGGDNCQILTVLGNNAFACAAVTRNNATNTVYVAWNYGPAVLSIARSFLSCQANGGSCSYLGDVCNN